MSQHKHGHAATAQKHTMLCLPSWLSVLPMLCIALRSCLSECSEPSHDSAVVAQRVGWDRPVKEERQTLMSGPQQEELSSGLQQQDAIWLKSRQLPEINAIPSVSPSLLFNNSLSSSVLDKPSFLAYFYIPFPVTLTLSLHHLLYNKLSVSLLSLHKTLSLLALSVSVYFSLQTLCLSLSVSISLLPPASLSLSSVAAQSVRECTKHPQRLV